MKKLSNKKGFTLVELLIVIALIGLVVAFTASLFGDPFQKASMRSGANLVQNYFSAIEQAALQYRTETYSQASTVAALRDGGYLTRVPNAPANGESAAASAGVYEFRLTTQYPTGTNITSFGGSGVDTVVVLERLSLELCQQINVNHGVTAAGATPPTAYASTHATQCFGTSPNYTALMPVYIN